MAFLAVLVSILAGCQPAAPRRLVVFAASSLTGPMARFTAAFQSAHPGVQVTANLAGSQQLLAQLEQGAHADVLITASPREMQAALGAGLVISGTDRVMAHNRLVVIYSPGNPARVATLADLSRPGLKLVLADPSVPAGRYALDLIDRAAAEPGLGADWKTRVLANVVSREENVKAVLTKVQIGEADAGIVYTTDVPAPIKGEPVPVGTVAVPDRINPVATLPIAPLAGAREPELAQEFIRFVLSADGSKILEGYGFSLVQTTGP